MPPGPGHQVAQRVLGRGRAAIGGACAAASRSQGGRLRSRSCLASALSAVRAAAGPGRARRLPDRPRGPLEQQRPLGQHELDVLAARDLDARRRAASAAIGSVHDSTWKCQVPSLVTVTSPPYRSVPGAELAHPDQRAQPAGGISQHHAGPEHAVALSDDGGADLEGLARDGLGRAAPALDHGLDVKDGDASDHAVTVPSHDSQRNPDPVVSTQRSMMTARESDPTFHCPRNASAAARAAA